MHFEYTFVFKVWFFGTLRCNDQLISKEEDVDWKLETVSGG